MADLWVSPYGSTIDFGKYGQFYPCNVCSGSQDKAWIKIMSDFTDIWKYYIFGQSEDVQYPS